MTLKVQTPTLLLTCCVILGKKLDFSEPLSPCLKNGNHNIFLARLLWVGLQSPQGLTVLWIQLKSYQCQYSNFTGKGPNAPPPPVHQKTEKISDGICHIDIYPMLQNPVYDIVYCCCQSTNDTKADNLSECLFFVHILKKYGAKIQKSLNY